MIESEIRNKPWFDYAGHDLVELISESLHLVKSVSTWEKKFHDYSFVVFPAAKAYEGFLKKLFLDLGFITKQQYYYKYFRIGKALNPELEKRLRQRESVYDKIVMHCSGSALADNLWQTWKESRNALFHWFPEEKTVISFVEAKQSINSIIDSMDMAARDCKIYTK